MAAKIQFERGAWWVVVHHDRKRQKKRVGPTKADKRRAEKIAEQVNASLALGHYRPATNEPEPVPFDCFALDWLRREVDLPLERGLDGHLAPSTARNYRNNVEVHLIPFFGSRDVRRITKVDVQAFSDHCLDTGRPRSPRSVQRVLVGLSLIMKHAVKTGTLERNPVAEWREGAVDTRKRRSFRRRVAPEKVMSAEELDQLLEAARVEAPTYFPLVLFLADTGCRLGEASALRWLEVDLHEGAARISRSLSSGTHLGPTKSGEVRTVELSSRLREVLRAERPDIHPDDALVFSNVDGGFVDPANFRRRVFARIVRDALGRHRKLTPHALRHTFATLHLSRGTNPLWVQRMGGWRSAVVMLDTYTHFLPSELSGYADALTIRDGPERHYTAPKEPGRVGVKPPAHKIPSSDSDFLEPTIRLERTTCSLRVSCSTS